MARIQFDTQKAFLIPDHRRQDYFNFVNQVANYCTGAMSLNNVGRAWNTELDPIVIIDSEFFSTTNWQAVLKGMERLEAKDVTETLI
jgi:hypothetical protein